MATHSKPKYVVECKKHGMERYKGGPLEVYVGTPKTRRERVSGCPMCHKEKKNG